MKKLVCLLLTLCMMLSLSSFACAEGDVKIVKLMCTEKWAPDLIEEFNRTHTDIQIEQIYMSGGWSEFDQKIATLIAANEMPDIAFTSFNSVSAYSAQGYLRDVTDLVAQDLNMDDFVDGVFEAQAVNGRYYGIPGDIRVEQVWYNRNVFDAMGVEYPSSDWNDALSVEEWIELERKLVGTNSVTGKEIYGHGNQGNVWYFTQLQWLMPAYGVDKIFDENGMPTWTSDGCVAMMKDLIAMYNEGLLCPRDVFAGNGYLTLLANDQMGTYTGSTSYTGEFKDYNISPMPNPGGSGNFWIDTWALYENSQEPEAAWEVAKWLCSEEYWTWYMANEIGGGMPIHKESFEKARTTLWPWLSQEDRDCLFQAVEFAVPGQTHPKMTSLNPSSKELLDQVLTGGYDTAEEVLQAVQDEWVAIINDEI